MIAKLRYTRPIRWWQRAVVWRVEGWLLAWAENADPTYSEPGVRLLGETEDGEWLVPNGFRDGEPWWQGYWRWWRPDHWPVYFRSRRRRTYVMIERAAA